MGKGVKVSDTVRSLCSFLHVNPILGEHAGFADYMIYPFYERLALSAQPDAEIIQEINFPNKEHYPQLTEWFQNMSSLPEVYSYFLLSVLHFLSILYYKVWNFP